MLLNYFSNDCLKGRCKGRCFSKQRSFFDEFLKLQKDNIKFCRCTPAV